MKIFAPKDKNAILTVPNIITLSGFVFAGMYVKSFLGGSGVGVIFLYLFLAGMTDALDGFFARYLKQETFCGAILDPVRDRALMLAVLWNFWLMSGESSVACFLILAILFFEALVSVLNFQTTKDECRKIYHFYGKTRQMGHVMAAGLGVIGILDAKIALYIIFVFSISAFHGAIIGYCRERRMIWKDLG